MKKDYLKTNNSQASHVNQNKNRPEIRDDMDSREGEEQESKGDNTTHNKKEVKSKNPEKRTKTNRIDSGV